MILHGYWRSGAAYRVRIALNLKSIAYEQVTHDLRRGEQRDASYATLNPNRVVPALEVNGTVLTQSSAIIEWLEERHPDPPLLPGSREDRALVRALVGTIASDTHPLHNLRVLQALRDQFGADEDAVQAWTRGWIANGLAACEAMVARTGGQFAFGDTPTMADCFVVPQLYSAERFGVDLSPYPRLTAARDAACALPAVAAAHPSRQPDADPA